MKNFKQDSRFSGRKPGGRLPAGRHGRDSWKGRSFGRDRADSRDSMFDTICSLCGDECQVPFRPDGRKPVKCRNCFKKDGAQGRFMRDANSQNRAPRADNSKIEARLDVIEAKLDVLIDALREQA